MRIITRQQSLKPCHQDKVVQTVLELHVKGHKWEQVASRKGFHKQSQLPDRKLLESVEFIWIVTHMQTGAAGNIHNILYLQWHSSREGNNAQWWVRALTFFLDVRKRVSSVPKCRGRIKNHYSVVVRQVWAKQGTLTYICFIPGEEEQACLF